jgi:Glycosyltransferases involved in cell wall biogenesis
MAMHRKKGFALTEIKVSIVMPAYNAQAHIEGVFKRIPDQIWSNLVNCWVINDGSSDKTGVLIDKLSQTNPKIKPVHFEKNQGYGTAVSAGLLRCKSDPCDAAVCLHADGQYPPEILPGALETMRAKSYDIMQGSRIASGTALSGGMPLYKYVANRLLTRMENKVFGLSMSDYHSGMLFYSRKALVALPFGRFSGSFDFDVEVIACARAKGLSIGEIPVPTHYGDEISHVNSIVYGFRVLNVMKKYFSGGYVNL